jgi:3-keto-5-aminohexanoate cleavage enzyme
MQQTLEKIMKPRKSHWEEDFPVINDPPIETMNKKLVIEAAIPGWLPPDWWQERGVEGIPPTTIEGQAKAIIECVKAGATVIHTHPRDPNPGPPMFGAAGSRRHAEILSEIMDIACEEVDFISAHHSWTMDLSKSRDVDYISMTQEYLNVGQEKGIGLRDVQSALIMTEAAYTDKCVMSTDAAMEGTEFMEARGIKPMFSMQSFSFPKFRRVLFDNDFATKRPFWVAIQMGKHNDDQIWGDPWSYIQTINNISMFREALPDDTFLALHAAGRNWLPVATIGILYGIELIRVGLEDQFWLYPHRNDISVHASDTVKIVADLATTLGREIATVEEARERIGIEYRPPEK